MTNGSNNRFAPGAVENETEWAPLAAQISDTISGAMNCVTDASMIVKDMIGECQSIEDDIEVNLNVLGHLERQIYPLASGPSTLAVIVMQHLAGLKLSLQTVRAACQAALDSGFFESE